jgi:hypothetical protein
MAGIKNPHRSEEADRLFKAPEYKLVNGEAVKYSDVKVHEFNMGDVEDPDLYAAQPLSEWQNSEIGQWVLEHAVETPFWHRVTDPYNYGYKYYIIARLAEKDQLYWALKWK